MVREKKKKHTHREIETAKEKEFVCFFVNLSVLINLKF